jgi:threonine/homoserine/homoserine lactone efflux protein
MNWDLFAAFLLITVVLVITPGPIVTLVIATGAREGTRAALTTVVGTTLGNAVLLAAIAFGLSWVVRNAAMLFEIFGGSARPIWSGSASRRGAMPARSSARRRRRAGTCTCGAVLRSRYPTRKASRFSRPSCRSSSIPPCRSNRSLR